MVNYPENLNDPNNKQDGGKCTTGQIVGGWVETGQDRTDKGRGREG